VHWRFENPASISATTASECSASGGLPLATYQAGKTVLAAASRTGWLLILKKGAVEVLKEGVEITRVTEPGTVFGELSVLLDQPHTADVRALDCRARSNWRREVDIRARRV
jgi:CRP-like cAMP-binding protein